MLQEFDISITAVGNDRYLVRTEQVAPGVPLAQEQFHWPIDQWLEEASTLMHDPLLGILKGEPSQRWASTPKYRSGNNDDDDPAAPLPTLVSLGQALYNGLFDRALRDSWLTAQGVAQNRRSPLRLRLGLKGERLQQLPWEVLHAGDRPLGTGTDVTFSRYHLGRRQGYDRPVATVPDFDQPLRVLMVIATPTDQDRLELANEVEQLQNELHPPSLRSGNSYNVLPKQQLDVQLTVLKQPGRAELTQALEQGNYQALHYAGHSNLGNAGGDLYLVSRQTGLTERISGEDLAGLLSNNGVKLAVLNSCRGAYAQSAGGWHEQNLAQALVNRGIPGVIAMAERIPDNVAITFTQLLYRNLKQGNPIDLCLNRTRQGLISAHGSHYSYWALPILYMQPGFDGYLASKPGTDNSALDKLLSESESALKALDPPDVAIPGSNDAAVANAAEASSTAAHSIDSDQVNLDDLVETVELDEFLRYDNDSDDASVPELVEKLSQPADPDQVMLADIDESLIPETLETPGLDLYEQLPKKPAPQPEPDEEKTIYSDEHRPDLEQAEPAASSTHKSSGISKRRQRQIALGVGAAAVLGIVGIGISDPLGWGPSPVSPPQLTPTTDSPPSNLQSVSQVISGDPDRIVEVLAEKAETEGLSAALKLTDALYSERTKQSTPTLFFSKGQFQWAMIKANDPALGINPSDAATSWEDALTVKSDWLDAQVALGFARYEQNLMDNAIALWEDAIRNETEQNIPIVTFDDDDRRWPMQFHAYLGLAIAYHQNANLDVNNTEKANSLAIAQEHWQSAIDIAGDGNELINPEELGNHWLWSEKALIDWRKARKGLAESIDSAN
ncbi:MAG: CHAT domain-containing protein [Cyanobacteria bacterium P01_B01_bin.77]